MDYSHGYKSRLQKQRKKQQLVRILSVVCLLFLIGIIFYNLRPKTQTLSFSFFNPLRLTPTPTLLPTPTSPPNSSGLSATIQDALSGTHGTYGIVVRNLKTGEYYGMNEHHVFKSGSLYKLWVMAVVYQQIQNGQLQLNQTLSKDLDDLANEFNISIDPTEPQTTGTITMTVQDALSQMITISDNNAALLLTDKIGLSSLAAFLQINGFHDSKLGTSGDDPTTSASDIALFFNKLYNNQLANQDETISMLTLLKQQRLNEKIPLNLPQGIDIAHKTGEIDDYSHDGGIIFGPNGDYILVVLSESDDTNAAIQRIATVSEAVYNYFNPNPAQ